MAATAQWSDLDFLNVSGITNLRAPGGPNEAARLVDVLTATEGLKDKGVAVVSTQGNIDLASPGATIDTITMATNDPFLVRAQTAPEENGVYIWNGAATPATRAPNSSTATELNQAIVRVAGGSNAGVTYRQTATVVTLGTDAVTWAVFGSTVSAATDTAAGIVELATIAETSTGTDATRAVTPAGLAGSTLASRMYAADFGDGGATQFDFTHNFNTKDVIVQVKETAGDQATVEAAVSRTSVNVVRVNVNSAPATNALRVMIKP